MFPHGWRMEFPHGWRIYGTNVSTMLRSCLLCLFVYCLYRQQVATSLLVTLMMSYFSTQVNLLDDASSAHRNKSNKQGFELRWRGGTQRRTRSLPLRMVRANSCVGLDVGLPARKGSRGGGGLPGARSRAGGRREQQLWPRLPGTIAFGHGY